MFSKGEAQVDDRVIDGNTNTPEAYGGGGSLQVEWRGSYTDDVYVVLGILVSYNSAT